MAQPSTGGIVVSLMYIYICIIDIQICFFAAEIDRLLGTKSMHCLACCFLFKDLEH